MIRTNKWKYILWECFEPQLFNLEDDPKEFHDLGQSSKHKNICNDLHEKIFAWTRNSATRVTISEDEVRRRTGGARKRGIIIGEWAPNETIKGEPDSEYWIKQ